MGSQNACRELAALEASDHDVHLEYIAVFSTAIGKQTLKKEVATWRVGANTKATQQGSAVLQRSVDGGNEEADPAIIRLRQCFQIFDLDGSETLDLEEFQLMLSYFRGKKKPARRGGVGGFSNKKPAQQAPKLTTAQVRNLFADLDNDESGSITCDEFERWWKHEREKVAASSSASTNFLSRGLDDLLLQSQGLLFWLLGRKQQLERKFVKKLAIRRAMESAKQAFLQREVERETAAGIHSGVYRCGGCGRRFGLRRDMTDHVAHDCTSKVMVVDTFVLKRWVHEEEFRLLEDVKES
ncbi:hypothetical protein BBJ28_00020155 [Nothophytophthora sp. Chile5]|nr:hypothetical protein BBJ28_00020155 [Nothophytophthora sp. Chile5]